MTDASSLLCLQLCSPRDLYWHSLKVLASSGHSRLSSQNGPAPVPNKSFNPPPKALDGPLKKYHILHINVMKDISFYVVPVSFCAIYSSFLLAETQWVLYALTTHWWGNFICSQKQHLIVCMRTIILVLTCIQAFCISHWHLCHQRNHHTQIPIDLGHWLQLYPFLLEVIPHLQDALLLYLWNHE